MVKQLYEVHASICALFSNPKRLQIIDLLREGERSVGELSKLMDLSQGNMSQHLALMKHRGILEARRDRANVYYRIANPAVIKAFDIMREVTLESLSRHEKLARRARRAS